MGIYYGYVIDLEKLDNKRRRSFEDFIRKQKIGLHTGYSVSAYSPTMAVLGQVIDGKSFLFNPTEINSVSLTPAEEDKKIVDEYDLSLIDQWKEILVSESPSVIIYDDDDD